MSSHIADDFAEIALRRKEIAAGGLPRLTPKPTCPYCHGAGWALTRSKGSHGWVVCFSCRNSGQRAKPL